MGGDESSGEMVEEVQGHTALIKRRTDDLKCVAQQTVRPMLSV